MNRMNRCLFLLLSLSLLAGCASTSSMTEDHFYRLTIQVSNERDMQPKVRDRIVVGEVEAYGIYHERAILYAPLGSPHTLKYHHYHHWIDKPTALVRDQLIRYLRQRGPFADVVDTNDRRQHAVVLRPVLKGFERRLSNDGGVDISIILSVRFIHSGSIIDTDYPEEQRAEDGSMSASVQAFNTGLERIYRRIADDLLEITSRSDTKISKHP